MNPEERGKQQQQNGIKYLSQDKEVNRIGDVTASILWWKKKSHSWFYLSRPSLVSVKAEKGKEEKREECWSARTGLLGFIVIYKGDREEEAKPKERKKMTVIKGERNELENMVVE